jgi:hypothetical protein
MKLSGHVSMAIIAFGYLVLMLIRYRSGSRARSWTNNGSWP